MPSKRKQKPKVKLPGRPERPRGFQPGNRAAADRGPNKITQDIKQGVVDAAAAIGEDGKGKDGLTGYLTMLARSHKKLFAPLLAKVIPLQINATPGMFIGSVNIVGVPSDRYLTAEQIRALQPPDESAPIIDGVQVLEPIAVEDDDTDEEAA